jgi:stage III sporulation protein SpoIIIAA
MEVVDRDHQHDTLLQAVQNHGPEVVMVDEIGNKEVSVKSLAGLPSL